MSDWYLRRQGVFHEFFVDIVARFKASQLVEDSADLVSTCTREFSALFEYFGALERWPLCRTEFTLLKIQQTSLWDSKRPNSTQLQFLAKCITACLMCKGRCVVIGSSSGEAQKMMLTLSMFIEPHQRQFCLRPYRLPFSPYLRLQAIKRSELDSFYSSALEAHWPISLIDCDRRSVTYSGSFPRHRTLKLALQNFQIGQIVRDAVASGVVEMYSVEYLLQRQSPREPILDLSVVRAELYVTEMLENLYLLPQSKVARLAYIDHFHLRLENHARAMIKYVKEISEPKGTDKSALTGQWSLSATRRALNLQNEAAFGISLARADSLQPDFAEFIVQAAAQIKQTRRARK